MRIQQLPPLILLSALLLSACTGTEDPIQNVRLALLTDGGKTLGYVDTTSAPSSTPPTFQKVETFQDAAAGLHTFNIGSNVALTRPAGIEQREFQLATPLAFNRLPDDFSPCLKQSVMNALRDRILTLSDCGTVQKLALYRTDRTLVWTATLPTTTPPIPSADTPPTRLAILGDVGLVARAALSGQSEVIRAAPSNSSDPVQSLVAVVSDPLPTVSIRDLAPYAGGIYAATDTGVRPLLATGAPDTAMTTGSVAAFGAVRVDRLWTGLAGSKPVMAAWRNTPFSTTPLWLWDGNTSNTARTVGTFTGLREVTFDLNSQMYTLTANALSRYDTPIGLA